MKNLKIINIIQNINSCLKSINNFNYYNMSNFIINEEEMKYFIPIYYNTSKRIDYPFYIRANTDLANDDTGIMDDPKEIELYNEYISKHRTMYDIETDQKLFETYEKKKFCVNNRFDIKDMAICIDLKTSAIISNSYYQNIKEFNDKFNKFFNNDKTYTYKEFLQIVSYIFHINNLIIVVEDTTDEFIFNHKHLFISDTMIKSYETEIKKKNEERTKKISDIKKRLCDISSEIYTDYMKHKKIGEKQKILQIEQNNIHFLYTKYGIMTRHSKIFNKDAIKQKKSTDDDYYEKIKNTIKRKLLSTHTDDIECGCPSFKKTKI